MKAIFISFNQALYEEVIQCINISGERGFTSWEQVTGKGSKHGEPHLGTHAWPTLNSAIICFVNDENLDKLLLSLQEVNTHSEELGIRTFYWDVLGTVG